MGFPGITLSNSLSNISIINCTFQQSQVCNSVYIDLIDLVASVDIVNSKFMHNAVSDASLCESFNSPLVVISSTRLDMTIYSSVFYNNGHSNKGSGSLNGSLIVSVGGSLSIQSVLVKNSSFISNGIVGVKLTDLAAQQTKFTIDEVNICDNKLGMDALVNGKLKVMSSHFMNNINGALNIQLGDDVDIELFNTTFANNNATADTLGTALHVYTSNNSTVNISLCNFCNNIGGNSIASILSPLPFDTPSAFSNVRITSSKFVNNKNGSALRVAKSFLKFYSTILFQDNFARSGAGIYVAERSQISMDDASTVKFINNTASLRGGAMYIDLVNCYDLGIVFMNFTRYESVSFINNSARFSGNSIYFNIPASCDVIRDVNNINSTAYIPYKFNFTQSQGLIGLAIVASPYKIQLCSSATKCDCTNSMNNSAHVIEDDVMLGQSLYFNTILCDYFNNAAEASTFQLTCIDCGIQYRLLDDKVLIQNGSSNRIELISLNADADLKDNRNVTLNISSIFSPEYKQLTATLSVILAPCNNGFVFNKVTQKCECYSEDDQIQCDGDSARIKLGYWFGIFSGKHVISECHNDYCNFFTHRKETRNGFYNLPEDTDEQCSSHRAGIGCGRCSEGYTLAYNSPDCVSLEKCSPGIVVLVIVLSVLYWTAMIAIWFGVAHLFSTHQVSPGYLYGIIFFYSIVDILLVTNFHTIDGVFYTATILSSFAKLNPQFLGKLCFIENLDAIDQQFLHYSHVVFVSVLLVVTYFAAKCNQRVFVYVNRNKVLVISFVILFSYTSLTSISLLLLKAVKFDGINGYYTHLSPHLKYFANRHGAYGTVALLLGLFITIGFPLFLAMEPLILAATNDRLNIRKKDLLFIAKFIKKHTFLARVKELLEQFQDSYKDQHRWFAAYYLICRFVIMLIAYYTDGYNNMIYYLQTACVIITMTHIWIQPYKDDVINVLDTAILLIMLLVVNLSAFSFSTSAITGLAICLIIAPSVVLFCVAIGVKSLTIYKTKKFVVNTENNPDISLDSRPAPR